MARKIIMTAYLESKSSICSGTPTARPGNTGLVLRCECGVKFTEKKVPKMFYLPIPNVQVGGNDEARQDDDEDKDEDRPLR